MSKPEKHHLLYYRQYHEANTDNRYMRQRALGMIALLDPDTHDALHAAVPGVPPLDIFTAQRVRRSYEPHPNPLQGIDNWLRAVEDALDNPKSHHVEKQVGYMSMHAMELQKPFIKSGLVLPEQRENY